MIKILTLLVFLGAIWGIIPEVASTNLVSLPELLELTDIAELDDTWNFYNNIKLDTGRLLIGKVGGAAWSKSIMPNVGNEWTIEFVFRSTGGAKDAVFTDSNGLSLFLAENPKGDTDQNNFGGPSVYDGFQFLFNNKEKPGLKIFSNDGSKPLENALASTIGNCEFTYLYSQVPFNLRVSFSKNTGNFKVQLDNNLCFQTDKLQFPSSQFQIGIAGNVSPASEETFEVLKLNVWDHLTSDAIDDHGLMNGGELKIDYKTVQINPEADSEEEFHPPSAIRESLLEKSRKYKEELSRIEQDKQQAPPQEQQQAPPSQDIGPIMDHINAITLQNTDFKSKLSHLESIVNGLKQTDNNNHDQNLDSLEDFKSSISKQYSEMHDSITRLNQKVLEEVREHQYTIEALENKVELLMKNHKELEHQAANPIIEPVSDKVSSAVRWMLITIIIVVLALIIIVYRLRHDVKHAKLL